MSKSFLVLHNGIGIFSQGDVISEDEFGADAKQRAAAIERLQALNAIQLTDGEPTHTGAYGSRLPAQESDVDLPAFAKWQPMPVDATTSHPGAYNPPTLVDNVPVQVLDTIPETVSEEVRAAIKESTPVNNAFSRAEQTPGAADVAVADLPAKPETQTTSGARHQAHTDQRKK